MGTYTPEIAQELATSKAGPTNLSAMLVRALDGLSRLLANRGFVLPQLMVQQGHVFRAETDSIFAWWHGRTYSDPEQNVRLKHQTYKSACYEAYRAWCGETGRRASSMQSCFK